MTTVAQDHRMARLLERAATMKARRISDRTWKVSSASVEGQWYTVHAAAGEPVENWTCECRGANGREHLCAHKVKVFQELAMDMGLLIAERLERAERPATNPRSAPVTPPRPDGGFGFEATIPLIQSAVKVAGDGGVRLTLDVAESDYDAVMGFVRQARGKRFMIVPTWLPKKDDDS